MSIIRVTDISKESSALFFRVKGSKEDRYTEYMNYKYLGKVIQKNQLDATMIY